MSMGMMAAAMAGIDEDSCSEELQKDFAAEIQADVPTHANVSDAPGILATSQRLDIDVADVSAQFVRNTRGKGMKWKHVDRQSPSTSKKARKKPELCQLVCPEDPKIFCHLEGKTCIPFWPQYAWKAKSKTVFIKVGPKEKWLIEVANLQRKEWRKGLEKSALATMESMKESNSTICRTILSEFKKVMAEAKVKHNSLYDEKFPAEMDLTFNGCPIFARTCTRQLHIRADKALPKWIREGFLTFLNSHFKEEYNASRASSQLHLVTCRQEKIGHYTGVSTGVRDKVYWDPEKKTWRLKVKKNDLNVQEYLKKNKLCMSVSPHADGDEFLKQRNEALIDACNAWNFIDKSERYRIKVHDSSSTCPAIQVKDLDASAEEEEIHAEASGEESDEKSDP